MAGLVREFVVADVRRKDRHDRDMRIAWHMAAFSRQKRLPPFKNVLARRRREQSVSEQQGVLEQLSEQYRIPLKRVRRNVARVN